MQKRLSACLAVLMLLAAGVAGYRFYLVHAMREPVLAQLKDPGSAQFRAERYFGPWSTKGAVLCGEVNAKNSMGGYVGFKRFEVFDGHVQLISDGLEELYRDGRLKFCNFDGVSPWWHLRW